MEGRLLEAPRSKFASGYGQCGEESDVCKGGVERQAQAQAHSLSVRSLALSGLAAQSLALTPPHSLSSTHSREPAMERRYAYAGLTFSLSTLAMVCEPGVLSSWLSAMHSPHRNVETQPTQSGLASGQECSESRRGSESSLSTIQPACRSVDDLDR